MTFVHAMFLERAWVGRCDAYVRTRRVVYLAIDVDLGFSCTWRRRLVRMRWRLTPHARVGEHTGRMNNVLVHYALRAKDIGLIRRRGALR